MSYPRAVIPPRAAVYHQKHGLKATCVRYGFAYRTMRRWLVERGVDPGTGEVCRKRPAVSRVDVPVIGVEAQAAILTDHLRDSAISGDKSAEMALVLQQRANAHIAAYMVRARKAGKVS